MEHPGTMALPDCGSTPRYLENLRVGGGYGSAPDGGADIDYRGRAAFSGDFTAGGVVNALAGIQYRGILRADSSNGGVNRDWFTEPTLFGEEVESSTGASESVVFSTRFHFRVWNFNQSSILGINTSFWLPPDYDGSPLRVRLMWFSTAAKGGTAGVVKWRVYMRGHADNTPFAISGAFTDVNDTFHAVDTVHLCDVIHTPEVPGKGRPATLTIRRVGSDAADTFNADAQLAKVCISYA